MCVHGSSQKGFGCLPLSYSQKFHTDPSIGWEDIWKISLYTMSKKTFNYGRIIPIYFLAEPFTDIIKIDEMKFAPLSVP